MKGRAKPKPAASNPRDEGMMRLALEQARKGVGRTHPNPPVGAVVVKGGKIVGRGFTAPAGGPHAEISALEDAGRRARGAELFTTLEPCDHYGKTPPCSIAILEHGVKRVVFASSDPNPLVNGKGVRRLKRAGVEVVGHLLQAEADQLYRPFFKFIRAGLPFVTLKAAITLDGKLATGTGESKWISGELSRARVHALRNQVDAVIVGAGTVDADDPRLTTRGIAHGRDPVRVVLDPKLRTAGNAKVYTERSTARTIVATLEGAQYPRAEALADRGVEVWRLPGRAGRIDLAALLTRLGKAGLLHVLVEGGATVHGSFLKEELWDELWLFVAPKLFGHEGLTFSGLLGVRHASRVPSLRIASIDRVGEDLLLEVLPATAASP
ncbi:MAG: Diaminohydroxyphosphoribosylaminopyrimidine deaminase [Myxococcaceae bacterium]|nr:Diaminohydroxyphosphoribosylaminopyrimidine deaminase [Myxococcaceae bacterium]